MPRPAHGTIVLVVLLFTGCEILAPGYASGCAGCDTKLEVHLNNSFDDDRVRVSVGDDVVFDGRVTTDYVLSLAEIVEVKRRAGTYLLRVEVNDSHGAEESIDLDQALYLQVRFYPEDIPALGIVEGIVIEVTDQRPIYD